MHGQSGSLPADEGVSQPTEVVSYRAASTTVTSVRSPEDLRRHLRANGRKVTPQRELIAGLLRGNDRHPTAEVLHEEARTVMPSLSLKTVYLVLRDLEELGEVRSITTVSGPTRFDPNTLDHQHLVCTSCGRLHDVVLDRPVPSLPGHQQRGFRLDATEVVFRGVCPDCAGAPAPPSQP